MSRLIDLSRKDNDEILTVIAPRKVEFEELLGNLTEPDMLVITLQILTNISQANFTENLTSVLSQACSTNFLRSLEAYITKLAFESSSDKLKNKFYHADKNKFWSNIIELFKKIIELLPFKARDELMSILQIVNQISDTILRNQNYEIDEKVKTSALKMYEELEGEIQKVKEKNKALIATGPQKPADDDLVPPENFRLLKIIPRLQDLYNQKPFIRPCKIKDPYNSVEHYLDVEFRLLREDFIAPLRTGIQEYLHEPKNIEILNCASTGRSQ